jgi:hypothetical protein
MSHPAPQSGNGLWRILVLDRDPYDRKYVVATVALAADVRPATTASPERDLEDVTAWVRTRYGLGPSTALVPLVRPLAWTVYERRGNG